jgi:UDP-N-acetylglucosamine 1-carboxyvinyltransferase
MNDVFHITGNKKLSGAVDISGSKNAALPILAATLGIPGVSTIKGLPEISDVKRFVALLESFGASVRFEKDTVTIDAEALDFSGVIDHPDVKKMRASILLLAPLLHRFGEVKMPFPGGCVLGKRSADAHLRAFVSMGAEVIDSEETLHLRLPQKHFSPAVITLPEISVTATENAITAAAFTKGITEIRLAAAEPHVQNLCDFLQNAGVSIRGIGTHFLTIEGNPSPKTAEGSITSDYLEAGTFLLAGILTDSEISIHNICPEQLDSFFEKIFEVGGNFTIDPKTMTITTHQRKKDLQATDIQTGVFPKFPTDLHPQFGVLMTQANGTSRIFETLFERKFAYLLELEKLGASVNILNPHEFLVHGPKKLTGAPVASQDIRAGAAMFLAALISKGQTEISNIHYLDRGYQDLEKKLRNLGADIFREKR